MTKLMHRSSLKCNHTKISLSYSYSQVFFNQKSIWKLDTVTEKFQIYIVINAKEILKRYCSYARVDLVHSMLLLNPTKLKR